MKLCHIIRSGLVFFETPCIYTGVRFKSNIQQELIAILAFVVVFNDVIVA